MSSPYPYSSPPKLAKRSRNAAPTRYEKEVAASGGKADTLGDPTSLGPWVLGDTVGKGASGRVRLARHCQTGKLAAVKIIPKTVMFGSRISLATAAAKHDKLILGIGREISIMKLIDHQNIMSLYDVFEADNDLYLLLEFVEGGELFDFLVSRGRFTPSEAVKYFRQIIAGIEYCHRFNIFHRDLKPENLLLDSDKNIKIADFGMAATGNALGNGLLETSCGSPHYASPEVVSGKAYKGGPADIWSCGVILFALLVGRLPFDDPNMRNLLSKVRSGRFEMPAYLPPDAKDLITRMLSVDPEKRITLSGIKEHPFFNTASVPWPALPPTLPSKEELLHLSPKRKEDVDSGCFRGLQSLYHGCSEEMIMKNLTSLQPNWEQAYYYLLRKYQDRVMESYDEGLTFGFESRQWKPPSHLIRETRAAERRLREQEIAARRAREHEKEAALVAAMEERNRTQSRHFDRPSPRTIARPLSLEKHDAPRTSTTSDSGTQLKRTSSRPRPRPTSTVAGPRPLSMTGSTIATSTPSAQSSEDHDRQRMPPPVVPAKTVDVSPSGRRGSRSDVSRTASTIRTMEKVNEHVVYANFGFGNPDRERVYADSPTLQRKSSADEVVDVGAVTRRRLTATTAHHAKGLGLTFPKSSRQSSHIEQTTSGSDSSGTRISYPESPDNKRHSASVGPVSPPQVADPDVQKFYNDIAGVINSLATPTIQPPSPGRQDQSRAEKRLSQLTSSPPKRTSTLPGKLDITSPTQRSSALIRRLSRKEVPERTSDDGYVVVKENHVSLIPAANNGIERKRRPSPLELNNTPRVASMPSPSPTPSPLLSGSDFSKSQGWFASLFNFRPATYTLYSTANLQTTRRECAKLLESYGVSVAVEDVHEGPAILRCYAERVYDVNSVSHSKAVRFRVQFHAGHYNDRSAGSNNSNPSNPNSPAFPLYAQQSPQVDAFGFNVQNASISSVCAGVLVQERGARSTLEAIAQRLVQDMEMLSCDSFSSSSQSH